VCGDHDATGIAAQRALSTAIAERGGSFHRRAVGVADAPGARQASDLVRGQIRTSEDRGNAGHRGSRLDVDGLDDRMRVRRTEKHAIAMSGRLCRQRSCPCR